MEDSSQQTSENLPSKEPKPPGEKKGATSPNVGRRVVGGGKDGRPAIANKPPDALHELQRILAADKGTLDKMTPEELTAYAERLEETLGKSNNDIDEVRDTLGRISVDQKELKACWNRIDGLLDKWKKSDPPT